MGWSVFRTRLQMEELGADGNAGNLRIAEVVKRRFEIYCGRRYTLADKPVCHAGISIWLNREGWNSREDSCDHSRPRCVASHTDDGVRAELTKQLAAMEHARGK